ncbi:hypothetical protein CVS30_16325 [Arthrobacter psychrolactophilus]|uniref:Uncharacterized protein n=1 Tax=Arthrobacter psychrolactophilus TaxID=92442 RepID=A0A2V5IT11_9MICC|nr:hypothetical protein [Arthrobacter psychrolactophilus]PYI37283.1 hypothetical protein CVS30_16325 [Arthrobacter psychrolactophilus]
MSSQNLHEQPSSTAQTAANEAEKTKETAVKAGAHLASTAQEEARNVAGEAGAQVQNVVAQFMGSLQEQAGMQQQKTAEMLHTLGSDLKSMADSTNGQGESSMAARWVREAATKASSAADWLDQRDPGSLVNDVKRFARRRPAAFLGIAVGAGLLAGRLTRNLGEGASDDGPQRKDPQFEVTPRKVPPTPEYVLAARRGETFPEPPSAAPVVTGKPLGGPTGPDAAGYGTVGGAGVAPMVPPPPSFAGPTPELGFDPNDPEPGIAPVAPEPRNPERGTGGGFA